MSGDLRTVNAAAMPLRASRWHAMAGWLRKRVGALVVFAVLFLLWEFAVHLFGIKEYLLPPPSKVWTEFLKRYTVVMPSAWVTLQEIVCHVGERLRPISADLVSRVVDEDEVAVR